MLERWMAKASYQRFFAQRSRRLPFAEPDVVPEKVPTFGWETLDRVLADREVDVLVVRNGEQLAEAAPRSADQVRRLFARAAGIVVRRAERHDERLATLAASFSQELGGSAHIQLFVTPGHTHGFGWHYDEEDVCILQIQGTKTYYFRENTQEVAPGSADFTRFHNESSPLMSCTLSERGMLYLPRHTWHAAKADEDSLSISVGVF